MRRYLLFPIIIVLLTTSYVQAKGVSVVFNGSRSKDCRSMKNDPWSESAIYMMSKMYKSGGYDVSTLSTDGSIHCIKKVGGSVVMDYDTDRTFSPVTPTWSGDVSAKAATRAAASEIADGARPVNMKRAKRADLFLEIDAAKKKLRDDDNFNLYITDHGAVDYDRNGEYWTDCYGKWAYGKKLADKIKSINKDVTIRLVVDNCHSAAALENVFDKVESKMKSNDDYVVCGVSAAGPDESSYYSGLSAYQYKHWKKKGEMPSLGQLYEMATHDTENFKSYPETMSQIMLIKYWDRNKSSTSCSASKFNQALDGKSLSFVNSWIGKFSSGSGCSKQRKRIKKEMKAIADWRNILLGKAKANLSRLYPSLSGFIKKLEKKAGRKELLYNIKDTATTKYDAKYKEIKTAHAQLESVKKSFKSGSISRLAYIKKIIALKTKIALYQAKLHGIYKTQRFLQKEARLSKMLRGAAALYENGSCSDVKLFDRILDCEESDYTKHDE